MMIITAVIVGFKPIKTKNDDHDDQNDNYDDNDHCLWTKHQRR